MSEATTGGSGGGAKELLSRKVGPIPVWGYGVVLGALLVWRWYSAAHSASSASSGTSATDTGTSAYTDSTGAAQVPQFVGQTYLSVTPPMATAPAPAPVVPPMTPAPTPAPAPAQVGQFAGPANVKVSNVTRNGVTLSWKVTPTSGVYPSSYTVALYDPKGRKLHQSTVNTPDSTNGVGTVTITGLPANTQVHGNVWPNGGKTAPKGAPFTPFHTGR